MNLKERGEVYERGWRDARERVNDVNIISKIKAINKKSSLDLFSAHLECLKGK